MVNKERIIRQPEYRKIADFMRGQSSIIMRGVEQKDNVVLVTRRGEPMVAIISYDRYKELTETGRLVDDGTRTSVESEK